MSETFETAEKTQKKAPMQFDRLPPYSQAAERGVLGCLLDVRDATQALSECEEAGVDKLWFYELPHQVIFDTVKQLAKAGSPVDLITVQQWLKDNGQLDQVGGITYLSGLQDTVTSIAHLAQYLELFLKSTCCGR